MTWWGWVILIVANLPVYWLFAYALLDHTPGLRDLFGLAFHGEDDEDFTAGPTWGRVSTIWWLGCVGVVAVEFFVMRWMGWV
jgi:hypothetical protein